ncbi:hypothetical protein [Algoriphagus resistens]|uniref:hypothetical protein n=1 Tax=Algoriphagus resistens TaxID=1750590 RepID=UPI000AED1D78|nr:hypothetical protein [Algoriphagus resistens]
MAIRSKEMVKLVGISVKFAATEVKLVILASGFLGYHFGFIPAYSTFTHGHLGVYN